MDAPFAVEAENIFFSYASELPVLRGLSMRVERGCFACVLGHSGCGKSTLLNLVMGLSRPSSGVVKINGAEAEGPGTDRAIVFQDCSLFPWMTAQENVAFAIRHTRKRTSPSRYATRVKLRNRPRRRSRRIFCRRSAFTRAAANIRTSSPAA